MDIHEKRVVRRKAPVIAQTVSFRGPLATAAIKQGILTQAEALTILREDTNRGQMITFLQSLESLPGPRVAFDKLCYLLEHLGYSWICDELWVELICQKGDLIIQPAVFAEAKLLVRERLGQKSLLDGRDLEELALLIATRYQVAKETFRRQACRSSRKLALDKLVVEQDIRGLCGQIDRCMTVSSRNILVRADSGCYRTAGDSSIPRGNQSGLESQPDDQLLQSGGNVKGCDTSQLRTDPTLTHVSRKTKMPEGKELSAWLCSLKSKINGLTNAYVSQVMKVPDKQRLSRLNSLDNGSLVDKAPSDDEKSSGDDDTMDSAFYDEIADGQIRDKRRHHSAMKSAKPRVGLPLHVRGGRTITGGVISPDSKQSIVDKNKITRTRTNGKSHLSKTGKASRRPRRTKGSEYDNEDIVDVQFELSDEKQRQIASQVKKDIAELTKRELTLKSRRCLSSTSAPRDMSELEQLFWQKRSESMVKCNSVGYYYFLSNFKRKRCYACAVEPDARVTCVLSERQKHHGVSSGRTIKSKLPFNLYDNNGWFGATQTSSGFIDDAECPGAIPIPGTDDKRCLACAYANKDLTSFYDAVVAPDGSRHFEYPVSKRMFKTVSALGETC